MRRGLVATLVTACAGAAAALAAEQTWTGKISDSTCGGSHAAKAGAAGLSDRECAIECIKALSKYVLVDQSGKVIPIANQDFAGLPTHADHVVKLTGELKGDAVTVSKIEKPVESK
jgi:uncharacterized protein YdeI (BOF family)